MQSPEDMYGISLGGSHYLVLDILVNRAAKNEKTSKAVISDTYDSTVHMKRVPVKNISMNYSH